MDEKTMHATLMLTGADTLEVHWCQVKGPMVFFYVPLLNLMLTFDPDRDPDWKDMAFEKIVEALNHLRYVFGMGSQPVMKALAEKVKPRDMKKETLTLKYQMPLKLRDTEVVN